MPILHAGKGKLLHLRKSPYLWQRVPGLPTPLAWWQPKADNYNSWVPTSQAMSYYNVANPGTYNAAPGTAPAWAAATGWTFTAASSQYLTTGVVPANDQSYSLLVCYNAAIFATSTIFAGTFEASGGLSIFSYLAGADKRWRARNGQALNSTTAWANAAAVAICGNALYVNGAAEPGTMGAWTGPATLGLYLGANNIGGVPAGHINGVITLAAVWSSDIGAYMASLYTALQAAGLTV